MPLTNDSRVHPRRDVLEFLADAQMYNAMNKNSFILQLIDLFMAKLSYSRADEVTVRFFSDSTDLYLSYHAGI